MINDDLEERMRQAITAKPLEPGVPVWAGIVARRTQTPRKLIWPRAAIAVAALAAGLAGVAFILKEEPPTMEGTPGRVLVREVGTEPSFFGPDVLLAQSRAPVFPIMKGDGPRGERLRGGTWSYIFVRNGTDTISSFTYSVARRKLNDATAWALVATNTNARSWARLDSLWVSGDSLRPLLRISSPGGTRLEQTFRPEEVLSGSFSNGFVSWKTTVRRDTTRFNEASIIRWQEIAVLLQTTPLNAGWKGSFPLSDGAEFGTIRPVWLNLAVDGEERVSTPAGTFDCWRLRLGMRAEPPKGVLLDRDVIDEPDTGVFFWVSKDKGWLIQQGHAHGRSGSSLRSILIEGREE